jgi:hypothetical protein
MHADEPLLGAVSFFLKETKTVALRGYNDWIQYRSFLKKEPKTVALRGY